MTKTLLRVLLASALGIGAQVPSACAEDLDFQTFLRRWEEAQSRFLTGDPIPWKQHASQGGDATILGGFAGFEKGWSEVGPRYDWAAAQ